MGHQIKNNILDEYQSNNEHYDDMMMDILSFLSFMVL